MGKRFFLIILFFLLSPVDLLALWPFFWDYEGERHFLGPLFSYKMDEEGYHITMRPFLSTYESEGPSRFLYPLGKISQESSYFIPFFFLKKSKERSSWNLLLLYGGSSIKGSYFCFFPFFGNLYNAFGNEKITFLFWPFYSYILKEGTETLNLIWPFISIYKGEEKGIKIWPIYGRREKEKEMKRRFLLWPFLFHEERNLKESPSKTFFFFPFFLLRESEHLKDTYLLFPFFNFKRSEDKESYKILWPLFFYERGEKLLGYGFFPFFSFEQRDREREWSFLFPIYNEKEWYVGEKSYRERRFLLLSGEKSYPEERVVTFWPFFDFYEKGEVSSITFPFIIPLRNDEFRRIVSPLFTLFEKRKAKGKTSLNLFYGLFTKEEKDNFLRMRLAFLFDYRKEEDSLSLDLLSGLLGFDRKGLKKIFFIPLRLYNQTFP